MRRLVYLSDSFPRLSQTFTLREVRDLQAAGLPITIVSLRPPGTDAAQLDPARDPAVRQAPSPLGGEVLSAFARAAPAHPLALGGSLLRALLPHTRPFWPKLQVRAPLHVAWGAWLARELAGAGPVHLHAQFTWGACTAAWTASRLLGAPFSFTSHSDFGLPLIRPKLREAVRVFVISEHERRRLLALAPGLPRERIVVHRLGVELPEPPGEPPREPGPVRLIAVGSLGPVKGHDVLLEACARLRDRGLDFRLDLVGEGPERPRLEALHARLRLASRVGLLGARPHAEVLERTAAADIVVLACRVTRRGDHDGIPVSLMEGMARGKPVVSTRLSGIPELVGDDEGGLLVPSEDPEALAGALAGLIGDADLRRRLGRAARERVARLHDESESAREAVRLFSELLDDEGPTARGRTAR